MQKPTPDDIKSARENAGDTQAEAAARVWAATYRTWQQWELGKREMPLATWELYLIKTDQKGVFV